MNVERWMIAGLLVLMLLWVGTDSYLHRLENQATAANRNSITQLQIDLKEAASLIDALKNRPGCCCRRIRIGDAMGTSEMPSEEIIQTYADNQEAIDKLWLKLAETNEDATLGDAVKAWLKQQPKP